LIQKRFIVEIYDKDFVLRVGRFNQGEGRCFHSRTLGPHAAAVIHDQAHRYRNIFPEHLPDRLFHIVFKNMESGLRQVGDKFAALVDYRGVQNHQARVGAKVCTLIRLGILGLGR